MPYREPDFLPWDGRRVPLTFVSGYLGAGKTTLINELLARTTRPIAVMVNDVGAVNIDARLIRSRQADTIELTDGCVCCSLSEGFALAFEQLRARPVAPDHVVIELSGVADPSRVLPWASTAGFRLDGVITLVAADQWVQNLTEPVTAGFVTGQVQAADLILLTKHDLADAATAQEVRHQLTALAPDVPIIPSDAVELSALLELGGRHSAGVAGVPAPTLFDRHVTELWPLPRPIERDDLDALLDRLPPQTVRAKGIAADSAGRRWLVQVVGSRRLVTELPQAEGQEPTDLVVITIPEGDTSP